MYISNTSYLNVTFIKSSEKELDQMFENKLKNCIKNGDIDGARETAGRIGRKLTLKETIELMSHLK